MAQHHCTNLKCCALCFVLWLRFLLVGLLQSACRVGVTVATSPPNPQRPNPLTNPLTIPPLFTSKLFLATLCVPLPPPFSSSILLGPSPFTTYFLTTYLGEVVAVAEQSCCSATSLQNYDSRVHPSITIVDIQHATPSTFSKLVFCRPQAGSLRLPEYCQLYHPELNSTTSER